MEYDEIKEKIVGWLEEKEQFRDKDLFFLFDDLAEEAKERVRADGIEDLDEDEGVDVVDPDGLDAYGEEKGADVLDAQKDDYNAEDEASDDEADDEAADEDESAEVEDDLSVPKPPVTPPKPKKMSIFAKKPKVKPQ